MQSIVKVKRKFNVTIPKKLRKNLPLKVGQMVEMQLEGDNIVLKLVAEDPSARLEELIGRLKPENMTRQAEKAILKEAKSALGSKLRRR